MLFVAFLRCVFALRFWKHAYYNNYSLLFLTLTRLEHFFLYLSHFSRLCQRVFWDYSRRWPATWWRHCLSKICHISTLLTNWPLWLLHTLWSLHLLIICSIWHSEVTRLWWLWVGLLHSVVALLLRSDITHLGPVCVTHLHALVWILVWLIRLLSIQRRRSRRWEPHHWSCSQCSLGRISSKW